MVMLTDEQRRYYASRNKRLLNAARAGVPYTDRSHAHAPASSASSTGTMAASSMWRRRKL